MTQAEIDRFRSEVNGAIGALAEGRRADGAAAFQRALDLTDAIADARERRDELAMVARIIDRAGMPHLALGASQEAVRLDTELGDRNSLAQDIIACGNALLHLENIAEARRAYTDALKILVEEQNWANAASASTNMAIVAGNDGDMDVAIELLERSLEYLAQEEFDETEIITRIALTQALEAEQREPTRIFEVAEPLFVRFWPDMRPDQRDGTAGPVRQAIERHLAAHPELDRRTWTAERFPMLAG